MKPIDSLNNFNIRVRPHTERPSKIPRFCRAFILNSDFKKYENCDVIFVTGDTNRHWQLKNKAYAPLLDPIFTELKQNGNKCISIADHSSLLVGNKATHSPRSITRSFGREKFFNLISPFRSANNELGTFRKILEATGAKKIIGIGFHPSYCFEARYMGVSYVEILHGSGYIGDPYNLLSRDQNTLPTSIYSLDKTSYRTFKTMNLRDVNVEQMPHPGLEIFKNSNLAAITGWRDTKSDFIQAQKAKSDRLSVLITTQWGYAGELPHLSGIIRNGFIDDVILTAINHRKDIDWQIRLHPTQYRNRKYRRIITFLEQLCRANPNVTWLEATTSPLPSILENTDAHITMSSMTSYEAAYFGVPTLLLCPSLSNGIHHQMFTDLRKTGHAVVTNRSIQELYGWLDSIEKFSSFELNDEHSLTWDQTIDALGS